ncbi:MAG: thioredoxin fold domain-containing protein [Bdellovibrionota bacterium]
MAGMIFFASSAFAASAPDFKLAVTPQGSKVLLVATPPAGHHFNVDAPMQLEEGNAKNKLKPSKATEQRIEFLATAGKERTYKATLYLCDDAKTFCEKHVVTTSSDQTIETRTKSGNPTTRSQGVKTTPEKPGASKDASTSAVALHTAPASPQTNAQQLLSHGFLVNQPELALKRARAEKKPMIIDFFGIWCPPCNMLDEEIFGSPEFKKASASFIKLKVDADDPISWPLKSRYKVGGYPTVVFATADGEETGRIVGFRPKEEFVAQVKTAWEAKDSGQNDLIARAKEGDGLAAVNAARIYLERSEYSQALALLELAKEKAPRDLLYQAQIGALEEKISSSPSQAMEDRLKEILETSLQDTTLSPHLLDRRQRLAEIYAKREEKTKQQEQLLLLIENAKTLARTPKKLRGTEYSTADLYARKAHAYEQLGKENEAKSAWAQAAGKFQKQAQQVEKKNHLLARGHNLELAYCLWKSGKTTEADALYRRLRSQYPREFTFHFNHARMLFGLKNLGEAKAAAETALKYSYGDNRLRVAHLAAQVHESLGDKKAALELIKTTLTTVTLPEDQSIRTHRYANSLRQLSEKLKQN